MVADAKRALRNALAPALARRVERSRPGPARDALFLALRRADVATGDHTRALMKRLLDVEVGRLTYGAYRIDGTVAAHARIGSFCSIAQSALIGGSNHPLETVSTHPAFYLTHHGGLLAADRTEVRKKLNEPVVIEDDVWIAANTVICPGVRIGRGAAVVAGAVVTEDVEPYAVMGGVPARLLRKRFDDQTIATLCSIPWTEWDDDLIRARIDDFQDVEEFSRRYGNAETSRGAYDSTVRTSPSSKSTVGS